MTDFLDTSTFVTKTTVSGVEVYTPGNRDTSTISSTTTFGGTDKGPFTDSATVNSVTAPITIDEHQSIFYGEESFNITATYPSLNVGSTITFAVTSNVVSYTIASTTSLSASLSYTHTIVTVDYDKNSWSVPISYDSSTAPISGSVGSGDDDDGILATA